MGFVMRVSANEALGAVLVIERMPGVIVDLGRARQTLSNAGVDDRRMLCRDPMRMVSYHALKTSMVFTSNTR